MVILLRVISPPPFGTYATAIRLPLTHPTGQTVMGGREGGDTVPRHTHHKGVAPLPPLTHFAYWRLPPWGWWRFTPRATCDSSVPVGEPACAWDLPPTFGGYTSGGGGGGTTCDSGAPRTPAGYSALDFLFAAFPRMCRFRLAPVRALRRSTLPGALLHTWNVAADIPDLADVTVSLTCLAKTGVSFLVALYTRHAGPLAAYYCAALPLPLPGIA